MSMLEVILPVVLLGLAFLLKLLIDRTATLPLFIESVLELPVDVAFLATSLITAFTISDPTHNKEGLLYFVIYIAGSVMVIFFWRRSRKLFESNRHVLCGFLGMVNYCVCISAIVLAVHFLVRANP